MKTLIIGGVAGGASTAARLRRLDENAQIIMFERTGYVSYANCGLPYYIGGEITETEKLTLQNPDSFKSRFNIDARVNSEVISINSTEKTVTVKNLLDGSTYTENYDNLVISTGAKAVKPNLKGIDLPNIYTVRTLEDAYKIYDFIGQNKPKTALVVGGGFIGVEMAENLHARGIKVSMVEVQNQVMSNFDYDMACNIRNVLNDKGIDLHLETGVTAFEQKEEKISAELSTNDSILVDMVVLAIGVTPDTELAKNSGITVGAKDAIQTDEYLRTNVENIYACGDAIEINNIVTGKKQLISLAGPANKQGRIIADNIMGKSHKFVGAMGSSVIKVFNFTASSTGLSEKMAKDCGFDAISTITISPAHASYYPNANPLVFKTVFEKSTGKVLGAQAFGDEGVEKRIGVIATAISAGMTCTDLGEIDLPYAPPYSSAKDQVNVAGFIMENLMTKDLEQFYCTDISSVLADDNSILVDVRKPDEIEDMIDGAVHIPLDSLRERMGELDKNKEIYVYCMSGQRSYVACRILKANGFNAKSLSGGIKMYNIINKGQVKNEPIYDCGVASKTKEFVNNCSLTADEIKSVKGLGFLHCKGTNNFNGRIITRNGKITGDELQAIRDAAQKHGNGEVAMTTRLAIEVQSIAFDKIQDFIKDVNDANLLTGGTGSKVRPVVSCKGTTCQYGLIDTFDLSEKIHERFYVDYHGVDLPHKFKIAVGGCPNNCVKPNLNDLGIVGARIMHVNKDKCRNCKKCFVENFCPIKSAKVVDSKIELGENCNSCGRCIAQCPFKAIEGDGHGYKVYIGGRWGKQVKHGLPLTKIFETEEEVLNVVDKAILLFRSQGISGERFADTVTRLGFEKVEEMLVGNELLEKKNEILGLNVVGGASC